MTETSRIYCLLGRHSQTNELAEINYLCQHKNKMLGRHSTTNVLAEINTICVKIIKTVANMSNTVPATETYS